MEGDTFSNFLILIQLRFQSTPSVWRETALACYYALWMLFQSTPSVWRETLALQMDNIKTERFQSTPSVWRETYIFFFIELKKSISIHSLRVEGDRSFHNFGFRSKKFQSTPSVWRETVPLPPPFATKCISIHSLRVEGDLQTWDYLGNEVNFNPLPPCGGRLQHLAYLAVCREFQSTPSVWRETHIYDYRDLEDDISIHSLRVEGDEQRSHGPFRDIHFNPLPPCGGRRGNPPARTCCHPISIHSLRVEGDYLVCLHVIYLR